MQTVDELQVIIQKAQTYLDFYGQVVHGYQAARHHEVWIEKLEGVERGEIKRLLIIAPPGHAKSTWTSIIFPCWYLGRHPRESVLCFGPSDNMAKHIGTAVKGTLAENKKFKILFPNIKPDPDRGWSTEGMYFTQTPVGTPFPAYQVMGYGSVILGARADGIILDDPLAQDKAQSAIEQEKARIYHDMTIDSRLHPWGWEVAIMTRWHQEDLAAFLMGKEWEVVLMPAIGHWGEDTALWPERYPLEWLKKKRVGIGGQQFSCLYQGDPSTMGGSVFKEARWFRPLPNGLDKDSLRIVQGWDLAFSKKETADYAAAITMGIDSRQNLYILNIVRKRFGTLELVDALVEAIKLNQPHLIAIEEPAYRQNVTRDLIKQVSEKILAPVVPIPITGDKRSRAMLPAARAEAGMLFVDKGLPLCPEFEAECLGFDLAPHDDMVDALSIACIAAVERMGRQKQERLTYAIKSSLS